jgi:flagellar motor switch protein FliN/FliY
VAQDNDDLLDPAEIESLLNSAAGALASSAGIGGVPPTAAKPSNSPSTAAAPPQRAAPGPEALLEQAAADLNAAVASDLRPGSRLGGSLADARPFEFEAFDSGEQSQALADLGTLKDVELDLRIELGRAELLIDEVLKLREGSVVPLDKLAGDPVDILVNGRLIARGEVLVLNDNFCVRVAEILAPSSLGDL